MLESEREHKISERDATRFGAIVSGFCGYTRSLHATRKANENHRQRITIPKSHRVIRSNYAITELLATFPNELFSGDSLVYKDT